VQLGGARNPPPTLSVTGSLRSSRTTAVQGVLHAATDQSWRPLPTRAPALLLPRLDGWVWLDSDGVSALAEAYSSTPEVVFAANFLVLLNWRVAVSVTMQTIEYADVNASGAVAIGGSAGFIANVSGAIDSEAETAALRVVSGGGWVPFAALPQFVSPAFEADLSIGGATVFALGVAAHHPAPVAVIPDVLTLLGTGDASGPSLMVALQQTTEESLPDFSFYLTCAACVALGGANASCLDLRLDAETGNSGSELRITGSLADGDLRPLAPLVGSDLADTFVIDASAARPLSLSLVAMTAPTTSLTFEASGWLQLDLSGMGLGQFSLDVAGLGSIGSAGMAGAFLAAMPPITLAGRVGPINASTVSLATSTGLPAVTILGRQVVPQQGFALYAYAHSPLPEVCDEGLWLTFTMPSFTSFSLSATCLLAYEASLSAVPSLNFVRLTGISIAATLTEASAAFSLGANFELATGNSSCTSADELGCLTCALSVAVGVVATPPALTLAIAATMGGVWVEPLGLYNFALADVALHLGIEIQEPPLPPLPREIFWQSTALYKTSAAWPTTPAAFTAAAPSAASGLLAFETAVLYQSLPHADVMLTSLLLPRFGFKIVIPALSLADVVNMAHDVVRSLFRSYHGSAISEPAPPQLASSASGFLSLSFGFDLELSLVQDTVTASRASSCGRLHSLRVANSRLPRDFTRDHIVLILC